MSSGESKRDAVQALSAILDKIAGTACIFLFGAMTSIVILGIFFRYILNTPLNWVEETARYLMIWGASLAISLGVSAGEHVGLTVILDSLKTPLARKILGGAINLIVFAFLLFMLIYSVAATAEGKSQFTQALGISMFLPKLAVPFAMGISAIQIVLASIQMLRSPDGRRSQGAGHIDI
ncbi:MAG TPA: TRAP transporter small permease [Rectinemataceae bacterium]